MSEKIRSNNEPRKEVLPRDSSLTDNQINKLLEMHGPAVPGAELVADDPSASSLIGRTAIPGHDKTHGRIVGFQKHDGNILAAVTWGDGDQGNFIKAVDIKSLIEHNKDVEVAERDIEGKRELGSLAVSMASEAAPSKGSAEVEADSDRRAEIKKSVQWMTDYMNSVFGISEQDAPVEDRDRSIIRNYAGFRDSLSSSHLDANMLAASMAAGLTQSRDGILEGRRTFISSIGQYVDGIGDLSGEDRNTIDNLTRRIDNISEDRLSGSHDPSRESRIAREMHMLHQEARSGEITSQHVRNVAIAATLFTGSAAGPEGHGYIRQNALDMLELAFGTDS